MSAGSASDGSSGVAADSGRTSKVTPSAASSSSHSSHCSTTSAASSSDSQSTRATSSSPRWTSTSRVGVSPRSSGRGSVTSLLLVSRCAGSAVSVATPEEHVQHGAPLRPDAPDAVLNARRDVDVAPRPDAVAHHLGRPPQHPHVVLGPPVGVRAHLAPGRHVHQPGHRLPGPPDQLVEDAVGALERRPGELLHAGVVDDRRGGWRGGLRGLRRHGRIVASRADRWQGRTSRSLAPSTRSGDGSVRTVARSPSRARPGMAPWVAMAADRGHRAVSHTADVILEAWAPDLAACLEEAVAALVGIYAVVADGERRRVHELRLPAGPAERQLLDLLDEVIFLLDTDDDVPVGATVHRLDETGGAEVDIWLA